jgi:hypothetical protein
MSTGEPGATEIGQAGFGGGPTEKALPSRDLAGGLPDVTHGSVGARGCDSPGRPGGLAVSRLCQPGRHRASALWATSTTGSSSWVFAWCSAVARLQDHWQAWRLGGLTIVGMRGGPTP